MKDKIKCPVCGESFFAYANSYEICPVCGWQDDLVQRNEPDYTGGANKLSLNQYRAEWGKQKQAVTA